MLGNVHTLDLSYTKVVDVSMLGNVHNLKLSDTEVVLRTAYCVGTRN